MTDYLPVCTTVVANSIDYDELAPLDKPFTKLPGEFYLRLNQHLTTKTFSGVTCNYLSIENGIHNYDSYAHYVAGIPSYITGKLQIDEIDDFVTAVLGPEQTVLRYDEYRNKMLLKQTQGTITLSREFADVLGFDECHFEGEVLQYSNRSPDIYRRFRPLYLCADFCDLSTFSLKRQERLLCTIDTSQLGPVSNKAAAISACYTASPIWRQTTASLPINSQLSLRDSTFSQISTSLNCKLAIELTFRTHCLYDQL